ncbi:MAG: type II secretion system protein GspN, partial [Desulfobacterales bacterium]|nr:type II secretion system protein GspN [Desulfobacterales bacterium]
MRTFRKWLLYTLYTLLLVVGFGYYLFPSDVIRGWLESRIQGAHPDFHVSIQDLRPDFPPGLVMRGVRFVYKKQEIAAFDALTATPVLLSLFSPGSVIRFTGQFHDGFLKGEMEAGDAGSLAALRFTLSGFRLEKSPVFREVAEYAATGRLDSKGEFRFAGSPGKFPDAEIFVRVSDVELSRPSLPPSLRQLTFKQLWAKFVAANGRIRVHNFFANGHEADARASGWIDPRRPLG